MSTRKVTIAPTKILRKTVAAGHAVRISERAKKKRMSSEDLWAKTEEELPWQYKRSQMNEKTT